MFLNEVNYFGDLPNDFGWAKIEENVDLIAYYFVST